MTQPRTTQARIDHAADRLGGTPVTTDQRDRATALLADLLATADRHGVTLADFDWVADLPAACVMVITAHDRKKENP